MPVTATGSRSDLAFTPYEPAPEDLVCKDEVTARDDVTVLATADAQDASDHRPAEGVVRSLG